MLRNLAAALLATALVAGPAFAAEQTGTMAAPAPAIGTNVKVGAPSTQPAKHLRKHVRSHTRKHVAHRSIHRTKTVHHFTGSKTHKAYVAPMNGNAKARKAARVESREVPTTRSNQTPVVRSGLRAFDARCSPASRVYGVLAL